MNYQQMGTMDGQMGNFFSNVWEDFRKDTIDPLVDDTLTSVGVDQQEIDRIKAEAGNAFKDELNKKGQDLLQQVVGGGGQPQQPSTGMFDSTVKNIQDQISTIQQNQYVKSVPGGIYTIALAPFALYFAYQAFLSKD